MSSLAEVTPIAVAVIGLIGTVAVKLLDRPRPAGADGTRERGRRSPRAGIVFYLFMGMLVGGAAVAAVSRITRPAATPEVRITSPANGGSAGMQETIRGTSRHLPRGDSIWVVLYIPSTARYYPQDRPADVQAGGGWNALAQLGGAQDAGRRFEVLAVAADAAARAEFHGYIDEGARRQSWDGLVRLPAGAREYDRVAVTRLP
ncbi:MAG TPA: hypothetical protein VF092_23070 [Longimicrobium sp.]